MEILRGYNRKTTKPNCTIKVDLQRAYDSVDWEFIKATLYTRGFPHLFVSWIMECVTTTMFSINVNGETCGYFEGAKGLRQGDLISHLLFVLCMDSLQAILKKEIREDQNYTYHTRCKKSGIILTCFADDLLLFSNPHPNSLEVIQRGILKFSQWSIMKANHDKSFIYLSKSARGMEETCKSVLGFQIGALPFKYLGVPLISSRLEVRDCKPLIDKLEARLSTWNATSLSYAGRTQLIKVVLNSMQVYWASLFLLPKSVTEEIDKRIIRFLWYKKYGRGMHRVAWGKVCKDRKDGELGIVSMGVQNKVLQAKLLWEVVEANKEKSLWIMWLVENRFNKKDIWNLNPCRAHLWSWTRLLKLRDVVLPHITFNLDRAAQWTLSSSGRFSSISARALFTPQTPHPLWTNLVYQSIANPRHIFILWVALNDGFVTQKMSDDLGSNICTLCLEEGSVESMEHLLFACSYSRTCVNLLRLRFGWEWPTGDWKEAVVAAAQRWEGKSRNARYSKLIFAIIVYCIWGERNTRLHGEGSGTTAARLTDFMRLKVIERLGVLGEDVEWRIAWDR